MLARTWSYYCRLGGAKATEKVGEAAIAYFIDQTPIDEVKQKFGFAPA
jgi:hypothetical protein